MGNFEKVVVLLILLVCAIVLGISLRSPEPVVAAPGPLGASPLTDLASTQSGQLGDPEPLRLSTRGAKDEPAEEPAAFAEPIALLGPKKPEHPTLSSLVDTTGSRELVLVRADDLRTTVSPDYMRYTCRAGDTWHTLADFYYGRASHAELLQNANEALAQLTAGESILVPKFDLSIEGIGREPVKPRDERAYRIYVVKSGDTLSDISTEMYGTSGRWMQIYDANRDVLSTPEVLSVDLKLRIP